MTILMEIGIIFHWEMREEFNADFIIFKQERLIGYVFIIMVEYGWLLFWVL